MPSSTGRRLLKKSVKWRPCRLFGLQLALGNPMEYVKLQFQTPQDFQKFRKMATESIVSTSIAGLYIICNCKMIDVATAINQFGAIVTNATGNT